MKAGHSALLTGTLLCAVFGELGEARAEADASPPSAAELHFERGRDAMRRGLLAEACEAFRASVRAEEAAGALLNLGVCEAQRANLLLARAVFRRASELLPDQDRRQAFVQAQLAALAVRIPRLTLVAQSELPDGTLVTLDGARVRGESVQSLETDPGLHRVRVLSPERQSRDYALSLREGERFELSFAPGEPLQRERVDRDKNASRRRAHQIAGIGALGVGVLGAGAAVVSGVMVEEQSGIVGRHCQEGLCDAEGLAAATRGRDLLGLNTAAWITSVAGVALGGVLLLTVPKLSPEPSRVSLSVRDGGPYLGFAGSF